MKIFFTKLLTGFLLLLISMYRYGLAYFLGGHCRFTPSCSLYAQMAIKKHGPWRGGWLSIKRLSHCHPIKILGSRSGYDPVP